uniref:Uncharacterized protein n=1 Tax=Onchocerca volvulus TaxID=6282 RepID=A0A8R1TXR4_ONCVO
MKPSNKLFSNNKSKIHSGTLIETQQIDLLDKITGLLMYTVHAADLLQKHVVAMDSSAACTTIHCEKRNDVIECYQANKTVAFTVVFHFPREDD